jgi:hypothetical protein
VNNWESPTYMISFENKKLRGDGYRGHLFIIYKYII